MSLYTDKLKEIITASSYDENGSLLNGYGGSCILQVLYARNIDKSLLPGVSKHINQLLSGIPETIPYNFCDGRAGLNWFFVFLHRQQMISLEEMKELCHDDLKIAELSLTDLNNGNYDFLFGGLGAAVYFLSKYDRANKLDYTAAVLERLHRLMNNVDGIVHAYDFGKHSIRANEVDFGLCHGLPSVLLFCVQCYQQELHGEKARQIADRIVRFLLSHRNYGRQSFFTDGLRKGLQMPDSRLAWCYGDLGIGLALFHAGKTFGDRDATQLALTMLGASAVRFDQKETGVVDACVCHGSAGIAHIYNKLWYLTGQELFKSAYEYWIHQTIELATHPDGIAGYKQYNALSGRFETKKGLLDGTAGIGLALYSYLTGDFSWDDCILLGG